MDGTDGLDGTGVGRGWDEGADASRHQNGSATIGSCGAAGGGKRWLASIASVIQAQGLIVSEQQNNTNRLHTNRN